MFVCTVSAGVIGGHGGLGGLGLGHGSIAIAAPVAVAAPVAISHSASSYQNSNLLALNPTAVVTKVAAPVIAAPVITKIATPLAVAPIGLGLGMCEAHKLIYKKFNCKETRINYVSSDVLCFLSIFRQLFSSKEISNNN